MDRISELNLNYNGLMCRITHLDKNNLKEKEEFIYNMKKIFNNLNYTNETFSEEIEFYNHNFNDIGLNVIIFAESNIEMRTDKIFYFGIKKADIYYDNKYFKCPNDDNIEKYIDTFISDMKELNILSKLVSKDKEINYSIDDNYYSIEDGYVYNIIHYRKKIYN